MERTRTAFHPPALHFYLYLNSTGKHLICCEKGKENETTHWKIVKCEKADRDSTRTCHRQLGGQERTTGGWHRPLEIHSVSADLVLMSRIELSAQLHYSRDLQLAQCSVQSLGSPTLWTTKMTSPQVQLEKLILSSYLKINGNIFSHSLISKMQRPEYMCVMKIHVNFLFTLQNFSDTAVIFFPELWVLTSQTTLSEVEQPYTECQWTQHPSLRKHHL